MSNPFIVRQEQQIEAQVASLLLPKQFIGSLTQDANLVSVKNVTRFRAVNTAPVTISTFSDGQEGQEIIIKGDGNTTVDSADNISPNGGAHLLESNTLYRFVLFNFLWLEVGSSGSVRTSGSIATDPLATNAVETGTTNIARGATLYQITSDVASRIVFYSSADALAADSGREIGTRATPGTGVLAEFAFDYPSTIDCGPVPDLISKDGTSNIYYAITNYESFATPVNIDIVFVPFEF